MFTVSVETHFRASHQLTLPDGSKEAIHEHNWLVTADISSDMLNNMGFVIDFHRLKTMIEKIIADFDNTTLEKNKYFQKNGSSAEVIARHIYEKLELELPKDLKLRHIRVVEEPGCSAKFGK